MCGEYLPVFYMCFLVNYISANDEDVPIWYVSKILNWEDAREHCYSTNGSLVRITEENYVKIRQCAGNNDVWTGAYIKNHPENPTWIEHIGCFSSSLIEDTPNNSSLLNSPQQCGVNCMDGRFFAVQENKCFCLNGSTNTWNSFRKRAGNCTHICNGNSKYFCGGSDSINIYGHVSDVEYSIQRFECIYSKCEKENETFSYRWKKFENGCDGFLDFTVCDDGSIITDRTTSDNSREICKERSAFLWSPGTNILDCNNSTIYGAPEDIGILINTFVNLIPEWEITDDSSDQLKPFKCFKLLSNYTNTVIKEESCEKNLSFVCQGAIGPKFSKRCDYIMEYKNSSDRNYTAQSSTDKSYTVPTSKDQNYTVPTSIDQSYTVPSSTDQSYTVPNTTEQSYTVPTSTNQSYTVPSSTDQSYTVPNTTEQSYTVPTSTNQSYTVPTSTNQSYTVPNSTDQSYTVPNSTDQSYTVPTSTNQSYTVPTSMNQSYTVPNSTDQSFTVPNSKDQSSTVSNGTDQISAIPISTHENYTVGSSTQESITSTLPSSTNVNYTAHTSIEKSSTLTTSIDKSYTDHSSTVPTSTGQGHTLNKGQGHTLNNDTESSVTAPYISTYSTKVYNDTTVRSTSPPILAMSEPSYLTDSIGMIIGACVAAVAALVAIIIIVCFLKRKKSVRKFETHAETIQCFPNWNDEQMDNYEQALQSCRNSSVFKDELDENSTPSMFASILSQQFGSDLSTIPEAEEDVYTLTFPGEYDELGKISQRHRDRYNNSGHIYSHTMFASDPNNLYDTVRRDIPVTYDDDDYSHVSAFGAFDHIENAYDTAVFQNAVPVVMSDNSYSHVQLLPQSDT